MTSKEKLRKFVEFKGITAKSFCEKTNLSNGFLTNNGSIGSDKIHNILKVYPEISLKWLISGKGKMIETVRDELNTRTDARRKKMQEYNDKNIGIPLIPLEAMAGFGTGSMQVMDYDTKTYIIPEFDELNVDFMIRVKGSSMYPKYNSGDIVGCKKLPLDTFFQWNKVYVLDTSQGAMIKRIHKSDKEGFLLLVSDNEKYRPFDIPIDDVYSLSIVMGVIRLE